jgi:hypothetical protein
MRTESHIIIEQTISEGIPIFNLEIEMLSKEGLKIEIKQHPIKAYASLEWMIPPLFFAYFAKPYFEGFLNKAGEDHYEVLKRWILKMNSKFRDYFTQTITATKSTKKVDKDSNTPNNFFGVYFKTPLGNNLKVFMPNCNSEQEDIKALSDLLDDLRKLYSKPESKFAKKINGLTDKIYEELYAVFNIDKGEWEFFTGSMLVKHSMSR